MTCQQLVFQLRSDTQADVHIFAGVIDLAISRHQLY